MSGFRRHGPAPSWELELDSLADRLRAHTAAIREAVWLERARLLPPCYGVSRDDRLGAVIRRAIELTEEGKRVI